MPPKKKLINSDLQTPKAPTKRVVKAKTPLKTPKCVKAKNPLGKNSTSDPYDLTLVELNARKLSLEMQLTLTNEVARAQLVKKEPKQNIIIVKNIKQTKVTEYLQNQVATEEANTEPKMKTPKKVLNSTANEGIKTEKAVPKKRQADSTVRKPIKRRKLTPQTDSPANNKLESRQNVISPRITRSRKKNKADVSNAQSPSTLAVYDISTNTETAIIKTEIDTIVPKKEKDKVGPRRVIDKISPTKEFVASSVKGPSLVDSRKPSLNSNGSGRSWIKDISSSSSATCITVSPNEFVRFDNKLPIVKLPNIDSEVNKNDINDDSSTSSSSSDSDESSVGGHTGNDLIDIDSVKLSISSPSNSIPALDKIDTEESHLSRNLDKLKSTMQKIDMEIINWLSYDSEDITAEFRKLKDKFFNTLQSEFGIITHCQHMKRIFDMQVTEEIDDPSVEHNKIEVQFLKPNTIPAANYVDNVYVKKKCVVNESSDDDDDALSLFAESITGMESSRMNSSVASMSECVDEYIPKPVKSKSLNDKYDYCPTKISEDNLKTKMLSICEKQNADSTSIHKEATETEDVCKDVNQKSSSVSVGTVIEGKVTNKQAPNLIASQFRTLPVGQSAVFRGVCFFNMLNSCKNMKSPYGQPCRFPHMMLDTAVVRDKLSKLNEEKFIQEYISMRNWSQLRRVYGMCFVDECARRELTRILVEMALDFVIKANVNCRDELVLKVHVIETTLLYLNNVDFSKLDDLLTYFVQSEKLLCDVFMEAIAQSQNFARFKQVFIKLVSFMVNQGRTFDLNVTGLILERVCILPADEALYKALVDVIKNTNGNIFENSMIGHFEKQIASKTELYDEYLKVKCRYNVEPVTSPIASSPSFSSLQSEKAVTWLENEDVKVPAPLPDTTDADNGNKTPAEPIITRTIDFIRSPLRNFNVPSTYLSPPPPDSQRVITRKPQTWRNVNNVNRANQFKNMRRPQFAGPRHRLLLSGPALRPTQRLVTYAETSNRYMPRRPGPNY